MPASTIPALIPLPASVVPASGTFELTAATSIVVDTADPEASAIGRTLAEALRPATGLELQVLIASAASSTGGIHLELSDADPSLGDEGYRLTVTPEQVILSAPRPAGLFFGVQTLRQLLPASIDSADAQRGPFRLPSLTIRDAPRFAWRGAMLDLARHFFSVEDIERFIDRIALYKMNRLHLHLTDDQGWRIAIRAWPQLTTIGGSTAVGGDPGGFLSQAEYAEIVAYAQQRYIVVVPEIDMPGHTNAALASIPELNCDGVAPPLYTGIEVGFSSLCIGPEATYHFVDDVIGELAALTPGAYLHIGGDEAHSTSDSDYRAFIERVQAIVEAHGKRMVGWEEIARADLHAQSIAQHWFSDLAARAVEQGAQVVLSPATRAYLDMQYAPDSPLGLHWAGYVEVRDAYDWDPAAQVPGVGEDDILGVEAPLWTETIHSLADVDTMAFPRLAAIAELAWSPQDSRAWPGFRERLAAHGSRWDALGIAFYRSPQIDWE
jgi:hexosaminidase